jgi:hypothetical protein
MTEAPPAATPAPAPTQTTRSPMAIMGLGGPPGIMGDMRQMMRNTMTMMSSNVEGRIATLKTELKITDAQAPQWDRFADALRSAAKSMNGMSAQMMETGTMGTLPARLERDEKMLSAHLNSLKTLKDAAEPFYAALSDEQKKFVDGLMIGPMGVM